MENMWFSRGSFATTHLNALHAFKWADSYSCIRLKYLLLCRALYLIMYASFIMHVSSKIKNQGVQNERIF